MNIEKANRDKQMAELASMEEMKEAALAATAKAAIAEEETCYQVTLSLTPATADSVGAGMSSKIWRSGVVTMHWMFVSNASQE